MCSSDLVGTVGGDVQLENGLAFFVRDGIHGKAQHGQLVRDLTRLRRKRDELSKPGQDNLHNLYARGSLPELVQESDVAVIELLNILHAVLQHGQPLDTHAEGKAGIL